MLWIYLSEYTLGANKTYTIHVRLRFEDIDGLNHNLVHSIFGQFNDGIFKYYKQRTKEYLQQ